MMSLLTAGQIVITFAPLPMPPANDRRRHGCLEKV